MNQNYSEEVKELMEFIEEVLRENTDKNKEEEHG